MKVWQYFYELLLGLDLNSIKSHPIFPQTLLLLLHLCP